MPRFNVVIQGEGESLKRARTTLDNAGIPWIGPAETERPGDPETQRVDDQFSAYLDAPTAEDAEARVRVNLPPDGDYTVEAHERAD
jgi:hypothetical protein